MWCSVPLSSLQYPQRSPSKDEARCLPNLVCLLAYMIGTIESMTGTLKKQKRNSGLEQWKWQRASLGGRNCRFFRFCSLQHGTLRRLTFGDPFGETGFGLHNFSVSFKRDVATDHVKEQYPKWPHSERPGMVVMVKYPLRRAVDSGTYDKRRH